MDEKEVEKKGKGKKWFWEKSFLFLFDCVFLRLPFPCTHHTTITQFTLTHTLHTIHHDALVHTITCKQGRVLCCLFLGVDSETHCIIHSPLHHLTSHNTPTNPTQTQLMVQETKKNLHQHVHCVCWRRTSVSSCGIVLTATDGAP